MSFIGKNIFAPSNLALGTEDVFTLLENASVRIDRIVSCRHSSPPGFWYDQPEDEWVMVLRGSATVEFADGNTANLRAGDYLEIARHVRHRVGRTDDETIWLAVHLK